MMLPHKIYLYGFIILSFGSVLLGTAYSAVSSPVEKSNMVIAQAHESFSQAQESDDIFKARYHLQHSIVLAQKAKSYNPNDENISKEVLFFKEINLDLENGKTELSSIIIERAQ